MSFGHYCICGLAGVVPLGFGHDGVVVDGVKNVRRYIVRVLDTGGYCGRASDAAVFPIGHDSIGVRTVGQVGVDIRAAVVLVQNFDTVAVQFVVVEVGCRTHFPRQRCGTTALVGVDRGEIGRCRGLGRYDIGGGCGGLFAVFGGDGLCHIGAYHQRGFYAAYHAVLGYGGQRAVIGHIVFTDGRGHGGDVLCRGGGCAVGRCLLEYLDYGVRLDGAVCRGGPFEVCRGGGVRGVDCGRQFDAAEAGIVSRGVGALGACAFGVDGYDAEFVRLAQAGGQDEGAGSAVAFIYLCLGRVGAVI